MSSRARRASSPSPRARSQRSCTGGPIRQSSKSTRTGPSARAPDLPAPLAVELVEDASTNLRERGIQDAVDLPERPADPDVARRHDRKLGGGQVGQERVLVENRLARPAARPVELDDEAL